MSPSFGTLVLDTRAPVVTWGPVDGTDTGEELVQQYTLDEPGITSAELQLADGRILPMEVWPDALRLTLPDDTPEGPATIRAFVRDDVWNVAARTTIVYLTGVPFTPPPTGPPPLPVPARERPAARLISDRVILRTRGDTHVNALTPVRRSHLAARGRYVTPGIWWPTSFIWAEARSRSTTTVVTHTRMDSGGGRVRTGDFAVWKRPESPGFEDELFSLDIL